MAYKDCYKNNNIEYQWLSFFDFDEFLEFPNKNMTIKKFLNNKIFEKCHNVKLHWLIYINNNSLYYENKPLKERLNIPDYQNIANNVIKSTVRGNLHINYWNNMANPHSSSSNKFIACSSSGKIISPSSFLSHPPDYKNAFLKHYYFKSFEEYCIKIKRSRSDMTSTENKNNILSIIKDLYLKNKGNKIKIKILKNVFKEDFLSITRK